MRDLIIKFSGTDEEVARFEGRMAMIVAVSEKEGAVLRGNIIAVHDYLTLVPHALSTMREVLGARGTMDTETERMLEALIGRAETAEGLHVRTLECLGQAIFVAGEQIKGRLQ